MTKEKPPKKKRGIFRHLVPRSLEGKAAVTTAVVLLLTVFIVWIVRWIGRDNVSFSHAMSGWRIVTELGLSIIVPIVLYWGLRRWNQVTEGLFPDIDHAWKAGIEALKSNGISTGELPIFLILGSAKPGLEAALVNASISSPIVQGIPNEEGVRHALQWYAGEDAIYLFCPGASSLSALARQWDNQPTSPVAPMRPLATHPTLSVPGSQSSSQATPVSTREEPVPPPTEPPVSDTKEVSTSPPPAPVHLQTIDSSQMGPEQPDVRRNAAVPPDPTKTWVAPQRSPDPNSGGAPAPQNVSRPYGTVVPDEDSVDQQARDSGSTDSIGLPPDALIKKPAFTRSSDDTRPVADTAENVPPTTVTESEMRPRLRVEPGVARRLVALPPALDTSDQLPRLQYVCNLLRRVRRPRCGINGIVTLIPFQLSQAGAQNLAAIGQSARGDLEMIQRTLRMRCPVTAMLIGLEQDRGFHELVRRLRSDLLSRRLGGRFDVRNRPTPVELNDHSDRLCDTFEDWIYRLFVGDDALGQQRGNRTLYGLMSRIRHDLKPRLRILLGQVFGCDPTRANEPSNSIDTSFFFSGCYFASSGSTSSEPAFVKGVMHDKLIGEQAQVEWTREALRVHRRFRWFALTGWLLFAVLSACLLFNLLTNR